MTNAFHVFKRGGIQFLLIPNGHNCSIIDQEGNNYGSYMDLKSFEFMAEKEGGIENLRLGKCVVRFECVRL